MSKSDLRTRWVLIGLTWLAFLLGLYPLGFQSLWRDEVDAILFATRDWSALLTMFTRPGENGPLYFILLRPWLTLLGTSEFAARFSSLTFGVLAVPMTYLLGRKLLSSSAAVWGALLVACSPYLIWYSQESKMYALLVCLSVISVWLLLDALRDNQLGYWIAYIVITSLSFYTHILAVALLPVHILLFVVGGRSFWKRWRPALLSFACLTLPYLPLAWWEIPTLLSSFETGHPFYPLEDILQVLFRVFSFGFRNPGLIEIAVVVFVLLAGTFLYRRNSQTRSVFECYPQTTLWLYLLIPVFVVFFISLGMPIFTDRYLIAVAIPFYLLLACGLDALRSRSHLVFGVCLAAILFIGGQSLWIQAHTTIKADFRSAAAYFEQHASPDDLLIVQMPYVHYNFEYYYRQPYHQADGLYTNRGMTPEEAAGQMVSLTAGHNTIWLLKSEAEMWDKRDLVQQWLNANKKMADEAYFERVALYRYETDWR